MLKIKLDQDPGQQLWMFWLLPSLKQWLYPRCRILPFSLHLLILHGLLLLVKLPLVTVLSQDIF